MAKSEIKLDKNIDSIDIDVTAADISIYSDNIKTPVIRTMGQIEVKERYGKVIIEEKDLNINNVSICQNGNGTIISNMNSWVIIINGTMFFGNKNNVISSNFGESSNVELIVPKRPQIETFKINTKSGNLSIEDLIFSSLIAKTMSGDITLNDIDMLFGNLTTMSGDIDVKILESIINYRTYLKSMSGKINQYSQETISPKLLREKHELEASSMSGDIKVLFKGKREK